ncbi:MAG TPA: hypothetical protein VHW09_05840 [Bryobacteraceae bacterium]|jgi:hypothetical protein|nr:hypothetical protein [Bryobacteraceae bacterium]
MRRSNGARLLYIPILCGAAQIIGAHAAAVNRDAAPYNPDVPYSSLAGSPCDLMNNGKTGVSDVQLEVNEALGNATPANDLNHDAVVDVVDIEIEIEAVLTSNCSAVTALITGISPNTLTVGQTANIVLTGLDTHWDNTTIADFGAGVTVNSISVSSQTSATVSVTIQNGAETGTRAVTTTTADSGEIASLSAGQTFTVQPAQLLTGPPVIGSLSAYDAPRNTTASITVTGTNLADATFQFSNPIPGVMTVPGPLTVVSDSGTTVLLSFPTGSDGLYELTATTTLGTSGPVPFTVGPSGPKGVSTTVSVQNILNNTWATVGSLPAGHNSYGETRVSVLNVLKPNWTPVDGLPAGKNSYAEYRVSVLNVLKTNWTPVSSLPAGQNSYDAARISVLNILKTNWTPVGGLPTGRNSSMALPVAVCAPPQCNTNQTESLIWLPPVHSTAVPAVPGAHVKTAIAVPPRLDPVEELNAAVEGRTFRLKAESLASDQSIVDYEVNGVIVGRTTQPPHELLFTVPAGVADLSFRALIELPDGGGEATRMVHVPVTPDAGAPIALPELRDGETAVLYAGGWKAEFFPFPHPIVALPALDGLSALRTNYATALNQPNPDAVFGDDPLGAGIAHDFAVRYASEVWAGAAGPYRFRLTARSDAKLRVDGKPVAEAVNLGRGWHKIEVEYFLATGAESLLLEWQQPGGMRQVLAPDFLRTALTGTLESGVPQQFDAIWFEVHAADQAPRYVPARREQ